MLAARLKQLPELSVRRKLWGNAGGGDGGSIGAMDTRPAMSETRCRDERLRGRGEEGERRGGGRARLDSCGEEARDCIGEAKKTGSYVGAAEGIRKERVFVGIKLGGRMIGDASINEWLCLEPCAVFGAESSPKWGEC